MNKRIASLLIGASLVALSGAAAARSSIDVGISFGGPVYAPAPVYVAPPPPQVVYYPRPVYVAPPEPVYYAPAPVYYAPPPYYYRRHHRHHHW